MLVRGIVTLLQEAAKVEILKCGAQSATNSVALQALHIATKPQSNHDHRLLHCKLCIPQALHTATLNHDQHHFADKP
jgi:hypothetical protein